MLNTDDSLTIRKQTEPYEYLSEVKSPERYDMSMFVKQVNCIHISQLDKDMNIDCLAHHVQTYSRCIQKIKNFSLGTQKFHDSVKIVTINYFDLIIKPQIVHDLDLLRENFKNLETLNLKCIQFLSIAELIMILKEKKINSVSYIGNGYDWMAYKYSIESNGVCLMLYDTINKLFINSKSIRLCLI